MSKLSKEEFHKVLNIFYVNYPNFFKSLNQTSLKTLLSLYQEQFGKYDFEIGKKAAEKVVQTYSSIPSLRDIIDKLDEVKYDTELRVLQNSEELAILEKMKNAGYFKHNTLEELPIEYQEKHFKQAQRWLATNEIPSWFLKDMQHYGYQQKAEYFRLSEPVDLSSDDKQPQTTSEVFELNPYNEPPTIEQSEIVVSPEKSQNDSYKDVTNDIDDLLDLDEIENQKLDNLKINKLF